MSQGRLLTGTIFPLVFLLAAFMLPGVSFADSLDITITVPATSTGHGNNNPEPEPELPRTGSVTLAGYSYPGAILTFIKNGSVIGTGVVSSTGLFERTFTTEAGASTFGIWARDQFGLISPTVSVGFTLAADSVARVSNIALPPTIGSERLLGAGPLTLYGSAFPSSTVLVFNNFAPASPPLKLIASADGSWRATIARTSSAALSFSYKAAYQIESVSILSPFSSILESVPVVCEGSDFNGDGKINITDLSILLFYWGKPLPRTTNANACVDQNEDHIVDLRDFSILMYQWSRK